MDKSRATTTCAQSETGLSLKKSPGLDAVGIISLMNLVKLLLSFETLSFPSDWTWVVLEKKFSLKSDKKGERE